MIGGAPRPDQGRKTRPAGEMARSRAGRAGDAVSRPG